MLGPSGGLGMQGFPCPPWAYGAIVAPGPSWLSSGFGSQNQRKVGGQDAFVFGTMLEPSEATLIAWADEVVLSIREGYNPLGAWAPHRSGEIRWGLRDGSDDESVWYYKCGDDGYYDLQFWPDLRDVTNPETLDKWRRCCSRFFELVIVRQDRVDSDFAEDIHPEVEEYLKSEKRLLQKALKMLEEWHEAGPQVIELPDAHCPCLKLYEPPSDDMCVRATDAKGWLLKFMKADVAEEVFLKAQLEAWLRAADNDDDEQ